MIYGSSPNPSRLAGTYCSSGRSEFKDELGVVTLAEVMWLFVCVYVNQL